MKYDIVTGLGYNCEISFRLENFFGKINAMPFSWSYVLKRDSFPDVIEDITPLFQGKVRLLEDHMILCENTNIKFHPRYDILLENGSVTEAGLEKATEELRSRVFHLKEKYVEMLHSNKNTLFLLKMENQGETSNVQYIKAVAKALQKAYVTGSFTLAVFLEKEALTPEIKALENEQIKICVLKKFAPRKHTDIAGDVKGWYDNLKKLTGESGAGYWKRLWKKRIGWFFAVLKKKVLR